MLKTLAKDRVKDIGGFKAAEKIEPENPENQAKIKRIETREIASIKEPTETTERLELRFFGLSRQPYWRKQKLIFSAKIFRKK